MPSRPGIVLPVVHRPRPNSAATSRPTPRAPRYGMPASRSSVSGKPSGRLAAGEAAPGPPEAAGSAFAPRDVGWDRPLGCRSPGAFLARSRPVCWATLERGLDAADGRELVAGLADRDRGAVLGLHAVHEVQEVARAAAGVTVPEALGQVDRAAGVLVVVERAADTLLIARADKGEAVEGQHVAEAAAGLLAQGFEVDTAVGSHVY